MRNSQYYLQQIPKFYEADYFFPVKCFIGYRRIDISEQGDITLCPFMGEPIGNVFKKDLEAIWFSEKADAVRQKMIKGKCPGCWLSCYGEENIRFTLKHGLSANWDGFKRYVRLRF